MPFFVHRNGTKLGAPQGYPWLDLRWERWNRVRMAAEDDETRECWVSWGCTFSVEKNADFRLVPKRWVCEQFELLGFFFEKARHQRFVQDYDMNIIFGKKTSQKKHTSTCFMPNFFASCHHKRLRHFPNLPSKSRSNLFDVNDVESGRSSAVCVMRRCGHRENGGDPLGMRAIFHLIPYRPYDTP